MTHELPSIFLVANDCIVLDKVAKGSWHAATRGSSRDESEIAVRARLLHAVVVGRVGILRSGQWPSRRATRGSGLFLVIALVVVLATATALHPAAEEPQRDRDGHLHAPRTSAVSDISSPVRYRGRARRGRSRTCARGPARQPRSRSTSRCSSIASTRSGWTSTAIRITDIGGMLPAPASPGGRQPGDRRSVPAPRFAAGSAPGDVARVHAQSAVRAIDALRCSPRCRIGCRSCSIARRRRSDTCRVIVGRIPDSLDKATGSSPTSSASSARATFRR